MPFFAPAGRSLQTLLFAFIIGILNNFYQAYSSYYSISAAQSLQNFLNVSYAARGVELSEGKLLWLWSFNLNSLYIGNILGTVFTSWLCEHFGRKMILLLSNCGIFGASFFSTLAIVFLLPELFLISRIFGALLSSLNFCAFALFVIEFPSTKLRGLVIFVSGVCYNVVANIGMLLGMDVLLGQNLEILIGFGMVPSFFGILTSIALEETPKFLLLNRENTEKALKALQFYQGDSVDQKRALAEIVKEKQKNEEKQRPILQMLRELFTQRHLRY
ncbi:hypothetical protein niasHT_034005 [Heterodera trifolii]|uniref:Major facilitator superfamily (MFS) profile domain-containing protein n=1 Tax=Heterodera trifolii TaxID=157864 RepID=A0ABD2IP27_9BILA